MNIEVTFTNNFHPVMLFGLFFILLGFGWFVAQSETVGNYWECDMDYGGSMYYVRLCVDMRVLPLAVQTGLISIGVGFIFLIWRLERNV